MTSTLTPSKIFGETDPLTNFANKAYLYIDGATANKAYQALSLVQLKAGVDITNLVKAVNGFDETTNFIDINNAGSPRTGKLAGRTSSADSSMQFFIDQDGPTDDARSVFTARRQRGVICIFPTGYDDQTDIYTAWPVEVGALSEDEDIEAAQAYMVSFSISKSPARAKTIPAS